LEIKIKNDKQTREVKVDIACEYLYIEKRKQIQNQDKRQNLSHKMANGMEERLFALPIERITEFAYQI